MWTATATEAFSTTLVETYHHAYDSRSLMALRIANPCSDKRQYPGGNCSGTSARRPPELSYLASGAACWIGTGCSARPGGLQQGVGPLAFRHGSDVQTCHGRPVGLVPAIPSQSEAVPVAVVVLPGHVRALGGVTDPGRVLQPHRERHHGGVVSVLGPAARRRQTPGDELVGALLEGGGTLGAQEHLLR